MRGTGNHPAAESEPGPALRNDSSLEGTGSPSFRKYAVSFPMMA